ncbi:GntR family transcriptional regulator, partial [Mesorhizobium sp. M7A.F.Ca.US.003.02.1.1]
MDVLPISLDAAGPKSTLATTVYQQLRDDLLGGVLEAESKLRVEWVVSK